MKAVQYAAFGGPEVLELVDVPEPHPGPSQVRIAVRAVGVNPIDWKLRSGAMGGELPRGTGVEAAGIVDELGDGVTGVAVGDRVFGPAANAAAEQALLNEFAAMPPDSSSPLRRRCRWRSRRRRGASTCSASPRARRC